MRLKLQRPPCGVQPAPCLSTKIKDTAVPPPAESPPTSNGAEPSGQFMSKSVSANLFGSCGSHCLGHHQKRGTYFNSNGDSTKTPPKVTPQQWMVEKPLLDLIIRSCNDCWWLISPTKIRIIGRSPLEGLVASLSQAPAQGI